MGKHGKHRALVGAALAAGLLLAGPASAGCRLAIVFAHDVSVSVDEREYALQRDGLAAALQSPRVRSLLLDGPGHVAITLFEWSSHRRQTTKLDWVALTEDAAIDAAAAQIRASERTDIGFPTGIGRALGFASLRLREVPDCARRVVDVAGDGVHNDGWPPESTFRHFPFDAVTVNGLVILGTDVGVLEYYKNEVIHGPGAFIEVADGYEDFADAMERKLIREAGVLVLGQSAVDGM